jgi:tetratricopeptide (TPR) repeat protein
VDGYAGGVSVVGLGPFALDAPVAAGGFGTVWRGRHRRTGAAVAVKILHGGLGDLARRRFAREVAVVARLDHPAVVPIVDAGTLSAEVARQLAAEPHAPWLCTPWVAGGTLAERAGSGWPLVRRWVTAVLEALAHAHARGVLHLDVKPANVLCSDSGAARLTDFGVAALLDDADVFGVAGSPGFMAPEQLRGHALGPSTDLYAVGCLVWALLEGRPPLWSAGDDAQTVARSHATTAPSPPARWPAPLRAWMLRCLEKRPEARFTHAVDALRALPTVELAAQGLALPPVWSASTYVGTDSASAELSGEAAVGPASAWEPRRSVLVGEPRSGGADDAIRRAASRLRWTATGHALLAQRVLTTVGRRAERTALWELARRVDDRGEPEVVALVGPRGCGTSHLARWLAWSSAEQGAARALPHLPDEPVARLTVCWVDEPDAEEVRAALGALARRQDPVLLVLAIGRERVEADRALAGALGAVGRSSRGQVLALEPLAERELALLAEAALDVDGGLALELAAAAAGSPGSLVARLSSGLEDGSLVAGADGLRAIGALAVAVDDDPREALRAHPRAPAVWRAERWLAAGEPARALAAVWPVCARPPVSGARLGRAWQLGLDALAALGASPTDGRMARPRALRAVRWAGQGRSYRVAEELAWLDAAIGVDDRPDLRAWRALVLARVARLDDPIRAAALCDAALPDAEASGDALLLGQLLERRIAGAGAEVDGVAARALAALAGTAAAAEWAAVVRTTEAARLIELGRVEEALAVLEPAIAGSTEASATHPIVLGLVGSVLIELGQLDAAREVLLRAEGLLERAGEFSVLGVRLGLATVDLLGGRPDIAALQDLEAAIRGVFGGPSPYGLEAAAALVRACAAAGEVALAEAAWAAVEGQLHVPHTRWAERHLAVARRLLAG